MKLAIAGPPQAGKTTLHSLLTGEPPAGAELAAKAQTTVVRLHDPRLEHLREVYSPRSFKPAAFQVTDFGVAVSNEQRLGDTRNQDALLLVLPAFGGHDPRRVLLELETEWTLTDHEAIERRLERVDVRARRAIPQKEKDALAAERVFLDRVRAALADETPVRDLELTAEESRLLRPYGLLTQKPLLLVVNVDEDAVPYADGAAEALGVPGGVVVSAKLEAELGLMEADEQKMFMGEYGIAELSRDRLIRGAFAILGLHTFFTVGPDEVRAWPIPRSATAWEAAGEVHSDIQRGFIRAEVCAYDDFVAAGSSEKKAKALHKVRLEGKDHVLHDADIVEFRFNV